MKKSFSVKLISMLLVFSMTIMSILPTGNFVYAAEDDVKVTDECSNVLERALGLFVLMGGLGVYSAVLITAGQVITIEDLIFNKYSPTTLNIYASMPHVGEGEYIQNSYIVGNSGISKTLNGVFKFFTQLAVIAYMIMLVYIGIRILLNTGTVKSAKYKDFLVYWVKGIAILFLFPFVIKYIIVINDTFVGFIYANKDKVFETVVESDSDALKRVTPSSQNIGVGDGLGSTGEAMQNIRTTQEHESNSDYMSMMFREALNKGWLVFALAWVVMVKQLLTLLYLYFKRLLMIIFLIAIFPLVTIYYALDKLADGKSQAFGNWCKEFMLNVFIQSFHAIVYVLCFALILEFGKTSDIHSSWILILIVIAFVSKGDDLLRSIFNMKGGGGDTVKSFAQTALQARAITKFASSAADKISNTFGSDSHVGHLASKISARQSHSLDNKIAKLDMEAASRGATSGDNSSEPASVANVVALPAQMSITEAATLALSEDATEEQRNAALDRILALQNAPDSEEKQNELNQLVSMFAGNEEQLEELDAMLAVRAAANALMVGGMQQVDFNEIIELLLERMKGNDRAAQMARSVFNDPRNLEKVKMAGAVKFKKPGNSSSALSGLKGKRALANGEKPHGTRKAGNRYSGRFRTPEAVARMNDARIRARENAMQKTGLRRRIVGVGASFINGKDNMKNGIRRFKEKKVARKRVRKLERNAIKDARNLNKVLNEMKLLERKGGTNSKRYQELSNRRNALQGKGSNIAMLRSARADYAKRGIYFRGIGKTQRSLNRSKSMRDMRNNAAVTYRDATVAFKENRKAKKAVKEMRALREKKYLSAGQERRLKELEKFVDGRKTMGATLRMTPMGSKLLKGRSNGNVRMTSAQRMLNRDRNRSAVKDAKEALRLRNEANNARKRGDISLANAHDKKASVLEQNVVSRRNTSFRGRNPNNLRTATKAQRILYRGTQKHGSKMIRDLRKKNPANLSEQERKILERTNELSRSLSQNNVLLTRKSMRSVKLHSVNKLYNRDVGKEVNKEIRKTFGSMMKTEFKTASQMIKERVAGRNGGNYESAKVSIAQSREYLRSKGVRIKGPNIVGKTESAIRSLDNAIDATKRGATAVKTATINAKREFKATGTKIKEKITYLTADNGKAIRENVAKTVKALKEKGIKIKAPNIAEKIEKAKERATEKREARKEYKAFNKSAKEAFKGSTKSGVKGIRAEIETAEVNLRQARQDMRAAKGDNEAMERARRAEERSLQQLTEARGREGELLRQIKETRAELRAKGVKIVSPRQAIKNSRLEKKIEKEIVTALDSTRKEMAIMDRDREIDQRRYQRVEVAARRKEEVIQETGSRVRNLANAKDKKRKASSSSSESSGGSSASNIGNARTPGMADKIRNLADKANERRSNGSNEKSQSVFAERLKSMQESIAIESSVRDSYSREHELVRGMTRALGIDTHEKFITGKASQEPGMLDKIADAPMRANLYVRETFGRLADPNSPSKTTSLSDEIMNLAKDRRGESRVTINGLYTPPTITRNPSERAATTSIDTETVRGTDIFGTTSGKAVKNSSETGVVVRNDSARIMSNETNVLVLNTQKELDTAKAMAAGITTADMTDKDKKRLEKLSCSIVAINESVNGEYTASDIIGHIDNVRLIMREIPRGTKERKAMEKLLEEELKFNIDDYESNARIQVLNDPTLIADGDPSKGRIMDDSIKRVKALPTDEILLSMLKYEAEDLHVGYAPIARKSSSYQTVETMAAQGIVTAAEETTIQKSLEVALKEKQRQSDYDEASKRYEESKAAMRKDTWGIVKEIPGAVLDVSVRVPMDISAGLLAVGIVGSNTNESPLVSAATASLGAVTLMDNAYTSVGKLKSSELVRETATSVKDKLESELKSKFGSKSSARVTLQGPEEARKIPTTRQEVIEQRKESLSGKTSIGTGETLTERFRRLNGGK